MSDFYVGYLPKAPPALAGFVRKIAALLGFIAVIAAGVLLVGQSPFVNSVFEFGKLRTFEGIVEAKPYPTLLVSRPGDVAQGGKYSRYLLVDVGKHGADAAVASFDGKLVHLQGQLIYRDGGRMVEVAPGSIVATDASSANQAPIRDLGAVTLTGEIVDSKCYLGVMNPGRSKVHRDCAARCLSGGIPPVFVAANTGEQYLLVTPDETAFSHDALRDFIAEPLTVHGELIEKGESYLLKIDAKALKHAPDGIQTALGRIESGK